MTTYHADIRYIELSEPMLIERNSAEFSRMHRLLDSVESSINRAGDIEWESPAREQYDTRLKDAKSIVLDLGSSFQRAGEALLTYRYDVEYAKYHVTTGVHAAEALGKLIDRMQIVLPFREPDGTAEAMRRFDKIPSHVRSEQMLKALVEDAGRAYAQADLAFYQAISIERPAREDCLAKLRAAYGLLPNLHSGAFPAVRTMIAQLDGLDAEIAQAASGADIALPGTGVKNDIWPTDGDGAVSNKLADIRAMANSVSHFPIPAGLDIEWIQKNQALIADIAAQAGIPSDMLAGILLAECDKGYLDNIVEQGRKIGGGDPDGTSFGPMQIQIRTAADVLGYDVNNLTDAQRNEIRDALTDRVQSMYIAAEYLERMKASSEFANVPPEFMTAENYRELAQRYNGGLGEWEMEGAREYGSDFKDSLEQARKALD